MEEGSNQRITVDRPIVSVNVHEQDKCVSLSQSCCDQKGFHEKKHGEGPYKNHTLDDEPKTPVRNGASMDGADNSDDPDELSDMADHDAPDDANDDDTSSGFFQFQPRTLGSLFASSGPGRAKKLSNNIAFNASYKLNGLIEDSYTFPSSNIATKEVTSLEDACSVDGANTSLEHESSTAKKIAVGSDSEIQCHNKENGKFQNPDMNSTHP
ncbi:hypothetical protein ACSBR1_016591 [Camellia fascicularis]